MYKNFFTALLFIITINSFAKSTTKENQIFEDYCKKIRSIQSDISNQKLKQIGDSLTIASKNNHQKINALIILIDAYSSNNQNNIALKKAKEAEKLAKKEGLIEKEIAVKILTASIYRLAKYNYSAINILKEAKQLNEKNKHLEKYKLLNHQILIELADNYLITDNLIKSKNILESSLKNLEKGSYDYIDVMLLLVGVNNKMYNYEESLKILNELDLYKTNQYNTQLQMMIQMHYGGAYHSKGDYKKALEHLKKAEEYLDLYGYEVDRYSLYLILLDTYKIINDSASAKIYEQKIKQINPKYTAEKEKFVDEVINNEKSIFNSLKDWINVLYIIAAILIISVLILLIYIRTNQRKQKRIFNNLIEKYDIEISSLKNGKNENQPSTNSPLILNQQTELLILSKLEEFEKNHEYTNNKLTSSALAYRLETNNKYLSLILKKYRNQNFKDYLNSKRIDYISKRLIQEPELVKYKINHLADISGFSSHSHFTSVFKKHTNLSPSEFINNLIEKNLNK